MKVAILAIILAVLGYFFGKEIRKNSRLINSLALVISIASILLMDKVQMMDLFIQGILGSSFLFIVMFTGALKKKSILSKKFMTIRKEYSILGYIFLLPHAAVYLVELIGDLNYIESWIGLIAFVIMIPLFITSFSKFRKKYKFAEWKKLHRWSYLAYTLVLVHVVMVSDLRDAVAYIVIFIPYLVMKLMKEYKIYKTKKEKATA